METQQQSTAQTTQTTQSEVSFDDISLGHLTFNENYRVSKGSASQLVSGLRHMSGRLGEPQNDYQRALYPLITQFVDRIVNQYTTTFLSSTSEVERRVYGTSLNGFRNDGSLRRSVSGRVNRNLTYSYAQFGQLLTLLTGRLRYVISRDASRIRRFEEHAEEKTSFLKLQYDCQNFLTFLTTEVYDVWRARLNEARSANGVTVTPREQRPQHGRSQRFRQPDTRQDTQETRAPQTQRSQRFRQPDTRQPDTRQPDTRQQDTQESLPQRPQRYHNSRQQDASTPASVSAPASTQSNEWQQPTQRRRPRQMNTSQRTVV
jgi:hypothetical protein